MGFTPLEGLMMGTRSGSVDPGFSLLLCGKNMLSGQQLDELLNKNSGLLGISGGFRETCARYWLLVRRETNGPNWLSIFTFIVCVRELAE